MLHKLKQRENRTTTNRVLRLLKQNMACVHVEPIHGFNLLPLIETMDERLSVSAKTD